MKILLYETLLSKNDRQNQNLIHGTYQSKDLVGIVGNVRSRSTRYPRTL